MTLCVPRGPIGPRPARCLWLTGESSLAAVTRGSRAALGAMMARVPVPRHGAE